jgi:hypothetical protein
MICLKSQHKWILFFVAFIATLQIGLVFRIEKLIRTVEELKPAVVEEIHYEWLKEGCVNNDQM